MGRKLFVGGLPWATDEDGLREAFQGFGTITYAKIVIDRDTGRSRGFGFVEFSTDAEAQDAIAGMDQQQIGGRTVAVNEARKRAPRRDGGGKRRDREAKDGYRSRRSNSGDDSRVGWTGGEGGNRPPKKRGSKRRRSDDRWESDGF